MEPIERVRIRAREGESEVERDDVLAVEEPLEIRVRGGDGSPATSFVTTMRTPGHDEELVAGLLFAEGVLGARRDLLALEHPSDPRVEPELRANVLVAALEEEALARARKLTRGSVMGSACGVCGKTSIENVIPRDAPPLQSRWRIPAETLYELPDRLRAKQSGFAETGGLHAAGLFDALGELLRLREDIGRHNALDKLVGSFWLEDALPLGDRLAMVSGRAGFELVQKAFSAGIPVIASVSAPSSLAVELAEATGVTLLGFVRSRRFNIYTHPGRVGRGPA